MRLCRGQPSETSDYAAPNRPGKGEVIALVRGNSGDRSRAAETRRIA